MKSLILLLSSTSFAMGSPKWCDVINELPQCPHKLTVVNGSGSGEYKESELVNVDAEVIPHKKFKEWIGDVSYFVPKQDGEHGIYEMPNRKVKIEATYTDIQIPTCETDPTLCEPVPASGTRRTIFLRNNASLSSHYFFSSKVDDNYRNEYLTYLRDNKYNEIYIYAYNVGDYGSKSVEYKTELRQEWRDWLSKIHSKGINVVMWLFADDSNFGSLSDAEIKARTELVNKDLGDLIDTYVPFLEINEAMDEVRAQKIVSMVKSVTGKEVGCHTGGISQINYCKTADIYFLQTGFGKTESEIRAQVKDAIAKKGKCKVVLAEYSKSGDVKLGNAGIDEGAIGCGNGCSTEELKCDGVVTPTPNDFDWSKVKKYGGPEISIAKDVGSWKVTSTLHSVGFSGKNLTQKRDPFDPRPCVGGDKKVQGCFAACVKDDADGKYICGTWDYEKCGGQTGGKTLGNFFGGMDQSFNLHKGSEICFFNTGLSRTNERNEKIRTTLKCVEWPY